MAFARHDAGTGVMRYESTAPRADLRSAIARIWQLESRDPLAWSPGRWALPDGRSEWLFVLGDPLLREGLTVGQGAHVSGITLACRSSSSRRTGRSSTPAARNSRCTRAKERASPTRRNRPRDAAGRALPWPISTRSTAGCSSRRSPACRRPRRPSASRWRSTWTRTGSPSTSRRSGAGDRPTGSTRKPRGLRRGAVSRRACRAGPGRRARLPGQWR
jgi:hypothetical protein